ncbi:hypothetical protein [Faecalibaculum rodentium]|uniref:hypothetical protein n=1 Tax=Faecalibaculum rodentium TaxID=1702221 RepID=UPI0023F49348|nr:hypothetical protein [Faecalibaculum rodentium]
MTATDYKRIYDKLVQYGHYDAVANDVVLELLMEEAAALSEHPGQDTVEILNTPEGRANAAFMIADLAYSMIPKVECGTREESALSCIAALAQDLREKFTEDARR